MYLPRLLPVRPRLLAAALSLLASLLAPLARANEATGLGTPCDSPPGLAPDRAPLVRDAVGLNFRSESLERGDSAAVSVCVLVDSLGVVRDTRVSKGGTPFDSAAVDAVRWWLFDPARRGAAAVPAWQSVLVRARPPVDADPLVPDVLALATDAEARGDTRGALDAWTGALARVGVHPTLRNEWVIREHILRLAASVAKPPAVPLSVGGQARGARNLMQRNIARGANSDYAKALDGVLRVAPWYVDAYRWRAAARAACGQRAGAVRDLLCYRLGVPDSASRALADRALVMLAAGDTLSANSLLKN